ncbi:hypothetical protein O9H85_28095 [Paenibacillus filicis]|uniref:MucB/RseB N-terminal domain-containing protein n=1 Tax=Paenibacillus gyeongsangnamensis TaxID=3388067 RepID=A0ABT4QHI0_9BACL|nr:hypothetical protein [Paenibacillus filicis]MCZ8516186.1 hypothetical protein [Paenibacillus filicis]
MNPIDRELKEGLSGGPLTRSGFSEDLRRRIERRIDEQQVKPKKWMPWFGAVSTALIAVAVLIGGGLNGWFGPRGTNMAAGDDPASHLQQTAPASIAQAPEAKVRSAVLIGLRTDHPAEGRSPEYSTYRTILLGPEQGELGKIAEGPDILMPYRMDFWRIAPQRTVASGEESLTLASYPAAGGSKPKTPEPKPAGPLQRSEKLLFAGNRYLSLEQTESQKAQGQDMTYRSVWVKVLESLSGPAKQLQTFPAAPSEPHVSLKQVFGESSNTAMQRLKLSAPAKPGTAAPQADTAGESWTIARKQGAWVPMAATYDDRAELGMVSYRLLEVPLTLPEPVATYDRLTTDWNEIRQIRPGALDAFSSPNGEMTAVVSGSDIVIYPVQGRMLPAPLLSIGLSPNESVVMVQWAAEEPYIGLWKQKAKLLLENK